MLNYYYLPLDLSDIEDLSLALWHAREHYTAKKWDKSAEKLTKLHLRLTKLHDSDPHPPINTGMKHSQWLRLIAALGSMSDFAGHLGADEQSVQELRGIAQACWDMLAIARKQMEIDDDDWMPLVESEAPMDPALDLIDAPPGTFETVDAPENMEPPADDAPKL
jgi:hypothetical protein